MEVKEKHNLVDIFWDRHNLKKQIDALNKHPKKGCVCGCCGFWYPADEIFNDPDYTNICEGCLREKEE